MPLFSVVIPTYNRSRRLVRAARSVLAQRFRDFELIVVDDGSTDDTRLAVETLGPRVRLVTQGNAGVSAARNTGVRHAHGDFVAFLDSDDEWLPWTLECHAALLRSRGATWTSGRGAPAEEARRAAESPSARHFDDYLAAAAEDGCIPLPSGVAVRRAAYLRAGGFDTTLRAAEDVDLWFRLGRVPGFVRLDAPMAYVRDADTDSLSRDLRRSSLALVELVRREREGAYPGSTGVRRAMLASELMGYAWLCRGQRHFGMALRLYALVAELQLRSRFAEPRFGNSRNRYLVTFPVQLLSPRLLEGLARLAGRRPSGVAG